MERPDSGTITLDGASRSGIRSRPGARVSAIELVPQELALVPLSRSGKTSFSATSRAAFGCRNPTAGAMARRVLDELGLDIGVDEDTFMLDPGEQRLVMFARTFHRKARLMIADEPTAGLGEKEFAHGARCAEAAERQGRDDHLRQPLPLRGHGDLRRVTVMRDGRVAGRLSGADITEPRLIKEMTGANAVARAPGARAARSRRSLSRAGISRCRRCGSSISSSIENEWLGFAGLLGSGRENAINVISGRRAALGFGPRRGEFIENPREAVANGLGILSGSRQSVHRVRAGAWSSMSACPG